MEQDEKEKDEVQKDKSKKQMLKENLEEKDPKEIEQESGNDASSYVFKDSDDEGKKKVERN